MKDEDRQALESLLAAVAAGEQLMRTNFDGSVVTIEPQGCGMGYLTLKVDNVRSGSGIRDRMIEVIREWLADKRRLITFGDGTRLLCTQR